MCTIGWYFSANTFPSVTTRGQERDSFGPGYSKNSSSQNLGLKWRVVGKYIVVVVRSRGHVCLPLSMSMSLLMFLEIGFLELLTLT